MSGLPAAYQRLHSAFRWQVPAEFNIAQVCCTRWAQRQDATKRVAVYINSERAGGQKHTYSALQKAANRLSHALAAQGVQRGDRVALVMPQSFETAVAYMAVLQLGAVAMPLSLLFGPEALEFRLRDSEAVLAIADSTALPALHTARATCPQLRCVVEVGGGKTLATGADARWADLLRGQSDTFAMVRTTADEPAVLIYTSGTTGNPKGALLAHRALIGNLTGFVCSQNWFGFDPVQGSQPTDWQDTDAIAHGSNAVFWSPADWAWTGGLMDALLPTLFFGRPIVAYRGRFGAQVALELMRDCGVTHTFLFPTALKAMMKACPGTPKRTVRQQFKLKLQALMSAGEAVGDAVFAYCRDQLGVPPNEMFGQTEINYIVGNCNMAPTLPAARGALPPKGALAPRGGPAALMLAARTGQAIGYPSKPGSMGMGYPGHRVAVIDDEGNECPVGVPGDVALNRFDIHGDPDPIVFLGYWKNEAATRAKYTGDWCRTGDQAVRDADGYLWYQGRSDDVFKSAGYRIGPGEIENCLVKHPAVANAAVVPKPDAERGALVKAYVVVAPEFIANNAAHMRADAQFYAQLERELQAHVRGQLAPYEYPKEIEFIDALPMTTTGKVQRRVLRLQEEARAKAKAGKE
ncbi:MAG: AMP-binding protein [Rhodoferax sp.]|nr:MAG: AMP-binding protein [Rhodoferax sp.]